MNIPETYQVGWVYVLGHAEWDGARVKIGMTTRTVEHRIDELNKSSMLPPDAYLAFAVLVRNPAYVEANVHTALQSHRVDVKRELFSLGEHAATASIVDYLEREGVEILQKVGTSLALSAIDPEAIAERQTQLEREERDREIEQNRRDQDRLARFKNLAVERQAVELSIREYNERYEPRAKHMPELLRSALFQLSGNELPCDGKDSQRFLKRWEGFPIDVDAEKRSEIEMKLMTYNNLIDTCETDRQRVTGEIVDFNWVIGTDAIGTLSAHRPRWLGHKGEIPKRYKCVLADTALNVPRAK